MARLSIAAASVLEDWSQDRRVFVIHHSTISRLCHSHLRLATLCSVSLLLYHILLLPLASFISTYTPPPRRFSSFTPLLALSLAPSIAALYFISSSLFALGDSKQEIAHIEANIHALDEADAALLSCNDDDTLPQPSTDFEFDFKAGHKCLFSSNATAYTLVLPLLFSFLATSYCYHLFFACA